MFIHKKNEINIIRTVVLTHYLAFSAMMVILFYKGLLFDFGIIGNILLIFGILLAIYKPYTILREVRMDSLTKTGSKDIKISAVSLLNLLLSLLFFHGGLIYILVVNSEHNAIPLIVAGIMSTLNYNSKKR